MTRIILILSLFVGSCTSVGVTQERVVYAMNTGALSIEAAQTTAELLYEEHQRTIIKAQLAKEPRPTQGEVNELLQPVREKWKPVWEMFEELRNTYVQLVALMDAKAAAEEVALRATELFKKQDTVAKKLKELREYYNQEKK